METLKLKSLTSRQINNLKQPSVKQCSGQIGCTLTEFLSWVEKHTQIPEDDDEVYVVSYEYELSKSDQTQIKNLRCFMTTKRLAKLALLS